NFITYIKQSANMPPTLYLFNIKQKKETVIYRSNGSDTMTPHAKVDYIHWLNSKGEKRGAVVRYPLNYDPRKKYPAIVDIYEKKYKAQHKYTSSAVVSNIGFNWRNYTEDGYFVIEPDIHYRIGETGDS